MKVGVFIGVDYGLDAVKEFLAKAMKLFDNVQWSFIGGSTVVNMPRISGEPDVVVVIGGDGSLLRFIHEYPEYISKPIIHVGAGRVNFLSEILVTEGPHALGNVFKGEYDIDERLMLGIYFGGKSFYALNEVVVKGTDPGRMMSVTVSEGDVELMSGRVDGVVVSTPTGSTAYNLALGGPVVDYRVKSKVITPIAPFSRTLIPIVHPYESPITISSTEDFYVICDGFIKGKAKTITVGPWEGRVRLVRLRRVNMYERLRTRLLRP